MLLTPPAAWRLRQDGGSAAVRQEQSLGPLLHHRVSSPTCTFVVSLNSAGGQPTKLYVLAGVCSIYRIFTNIVVDIPEDQVEDVVSVPVRLNLRVSAGAAAVRFAVSFAAVITRSCS